jgi:hypothetical protein
MRPSTIRHIVATIEPDALLPSLPLLPTPPLLSLLPPPLLLLSLLPPLS